MKICCYLCNDVPILVKEMRKSCSNPPETCVVLEMEPGVMLYYNEAVLLNEVKALGVLSKAAKVAKINAAHARELIREMNRTFSRPVVYFTGDASDSDMVMLSGFGEKIVNAYWLKFEPIWLDIIDERCRHIKT